MKCYATRNRYGFQLKLSCADMMSGLDPATIDGYHDPDSYCSYGTIPAECSHHEPIYDEFQAWVEEVRHEMHTDHK